MTALADAPADRFAQAACRDLSLWPWPNSPTDRPAYWKAAERACGRCELRQACAVEALDLGHLATGYWAGIRLSTRTIGRKQRTARLEAIAAGG